MSDLTTCTECGGTPGVCGTGGWSGPKPGDPPMGAGNIFLTATAVFGGISLGWNYPSINAAAVAYTKVFRGSDNNFMGSMQLAIASGNSYLDRLTSVQTFYYWIQMVSIHGTEGEVIGPVVATSRHYGSDAVNELQGLIDTSLLDAILRSDIEKITLNYAELRQEILDRIAGNNALSAAMALIQEGLTDAIAVIDNEIISRVEGQNVLASQINTIGALNQDNAAAIITERAARVSADEAFATQLSNLFALTNSNAAAITNESVVRANADSAHASQINSLFTASGNNAAAITAEATARTNADNALAQNITTVQTTLNGNINSVQTIALTADGKANTAQSTANTANSNIAALDSFTKGSLYVAKLSSNGLVGGFGVYNSGSAVVAGFDVDSFYIGRSSQNVTKPFRVEGNTTYIENAVIKNLQATNIGTTATTQIFSIPATFSWAQDGYQWRELGVAGLGYTVTDANESGMVGLISLTYREEDFEGNPVIPNAATELRIYRNYHGGPTAPTLLFKSGVSPGINTITWSDKPPPGWNTYHLMIWGGYGSMSNGYFSIIQNKR